MKQNNNNNTRKDDVESFAMEMLKPIIQRKSKKKKCKIRNVVKETTTLSHNNNNNTVQRLCEKRLETPLEVKKKKKKQYTTEPAAAITLDDHHSSNKNNSSLFQFRSVLEEEKRNKKKTIHLKDDGSIVLSSQSSPTIKVSSTNEAELNNLQTQQESNNNLETKKKKKRKKTKTITEEEIHHMATLLRNEVQLFYDPEKVTKTDSLTTTTTTTTTTTSGDNSVNIYKKGRFTQRENIILQKAINEYFKEMGWDEATGWSHLNSLGKQKKKKMTDDSIALTPWTQIAKCLPYREIDAIKRHAIRSMYPWKTGPWTEAEEKTLVQLVTHHGCQWSRYSLEEFGRQPNFIREKWKELEAKMSRFEVRGKLEEKGKRVGWTQEDDIKLLTTIRLVTGVPLPFHSVPWNEIQRQLPYYSPSQLGQRYRLVLFPRILSSKYKGAKQSVVFRQMIRYVRRALEAGVAKDFTEIETKRIVPFWCAANHGRNLNRFLQSRCPKEIQMANFSKQIEYIYKYLKCEKKEIKDVKRLVKTFRTLQELNGIDTVPYNRQILSESQNKFKATLTTSSENEANFQSMLFKSIPTPSVEIKNHFFLDATSLEGGFKNVAEGQQDPPDCMHDAIEDEQAKVGVPNTIALSKLKEVVPKSAQQLPERYPIYLSSLRRRNATIEDRKRLHEKEQQSKKYLTENSGNHYLDFHLLDSLGVLDNNPEAVSQLLSNNEVSTQSKICSVFNDLDCDNATDSSDSDDALRDFNFDSKDQDRKSAKLVNINGNQIQRKHHPWMY